MYYVVDLALRNPHQEHDPKKEWQIHNVDFGITGVDLALEKSNPLTTHIVLYWKYNVEWLFLYIF